MQTTGFAACRAVSPCQGGEQPLKAKQGSVSREKWLFTARRARPGSGEQHPAAPAGKPSSRASDSTPIDKIPACSSPTTRALQVLPRPPPDSGSACSSRHPLLAQDLICPPKPGRRGAKHHREAPPGKFSPAFPAARNASIRNQLLPSIKIHTARGDAERADGRQRAAGNVHLGQARSHPPPCQHPRTAPTRPERRHRRRPTERQRPRRPGQPRGASPRGRPPRLQGCGAGAVPSAAPAHSVGTNLNPPGRLRQPPARPRTRRHAAGQRVPSAEAEHAARRPEPLPANVQGSLCIERHAGINLFPFLSSGLSRSPPTFSRLIHQRTSPANAPRQPPRQKPALGFQTAPGCSNPSKGGTTAEAALEHHPKGRDVGADSITPRAG